MTPFVILLLLLVQYIHNSHLYLEATFSVCNLKMHHAMVTRGSNDMDKYGLVFINFFCNRRILC